MRKNITKRIPAVLLSAVFTALLTVLLSVTALAAYVPVEGKSTNTENPISLKFSYKKNGNLSSYVETYSDTSYSRSYKWKSSRISKVTIVDTYNDKTTKSYTYKKGLLSAIANTYSWQTGETISYKWKKKSASVTTAYADGSTNTDTVTAKRNSKKQRTAITSREGNASHTTVWKYYGNGNIKSITDSESGGYKDVYSYNKNGYLTSYVSSWSGGSRTVKLQYVMDKKKKCPNRVTVTISGSDGEASVETYEFTAFKKVKKVRNCDAVGTEIPLGVNYLFF